MIVLRGSDDRDYFSIWTLESGYLERVIDFSANSRRRMRLCADAAMEPNEASAPISRPRRLARDCERLPETLAGLHWIYVNERSGDPRLKLITRSGFEPGENDSHFRGAGALILGNLGAGY